MKIKKKILYYKRKRPNKSPATYHASQRYGVGTDIKATIKLDPILKDRPKERRIIINHEMEEIRNWGKGLKRRKAHKKAQRTKKDNYIDTPKEFWNIIKRGKR